MEKPDEQELRTNQLEGSHVKGATAEEIAKALEENEEPHVSYLKSELAKAIEKCKGDNPFIMTPEYLANYIFKDVLSAYQNRGALMILLGKTAVPDEKSIMLMNLVKALTGYVSTKNNNGNPFAPVEIPWEAIRKSQRTHLTVDEQSNPMNVILRLTGLPSV